MTSIYIKLVKQDDLEVAKSLIKCHVIFNANISFVMSSNFSEESRVAREGHLVDTPLFIPADCGEFGELAPIKSLGQALVEVTSFKNAFVHHDDTGLR